VIDGAAPLHLFGDELVLFVEKQDAELFARFKALREAQVVEHAAS
jgi:hypothetical protein